jgi:16S rRNA (adenine1518-N6/adenine1519-N6)-dimethyltransferase
MSSSLSTHKPQPKKVLGQNFLTDLNIIRKFVEIANLSKKDTVLEIGPGHGALTKELVLKAKRVIAIEKDELLAKELKELNIANLEIIDGDALKTEELKGPYKVVANIPYYLTSVLIRKLLTGKNKPKEIVLMIQKEVAERICSKPPKMNILAVSVNYYATPKIITRVSRNCFWPKPKVDSAIIKIIPNKNKKENEDLFFKIVKSGFSSPRKQLLNNLSSGLHLEKGIISKWLLDNKISPLSRAETLSIDDWEKLTHSSIAKIVK